MVWDGRDMMQMGGPMEWESEIGDSKDSDHIRYITIILLIREGLQIYQSA
jgi:hypothetical protein